MTNQQAQSYAMSLLATYDVDDQGPYEKAVVRISRAWLSLLRARHPVGGIVVRLREELKHEPPPNPGLAWDELREAFDRWARATGWLQPWES